MRYFGKSRANLLAVIAAAAVTVGVRYAVFVPDSNLLIVSAVFVATYSAIVLCTKIAHRPRS